MTLPKIKQVRAWFTGGATAEKGAGGGDYHDQGANHLTVSLRVNVSVISN